MNVYRYQRMLDDIPNRAKSYGDFIVKHADRQIVESVADYGEMLQSGAKESHTDYVTFFLCFRQINKLIPGYMADIGILGEHDHDLVEEMEKSIAIHVATLTRAGAA